MSDTPKTWPYWPAAERVQDEAYDVAQVTADAIAEILAFTVQRPRHLAINEILLRPASQV